MTRAATSKGIPEHIDVPNVALDDRATLAVMKFCRRIIESVYPDISEGDREMKAQLLAKRAANKLESTGVSITMAELSRSLLDDILIRTNSTI